MRFAVLVTAFVAAMASRGGCGASGPPYDPCGDKACREACRLCPADDPGCVETAELKVCDPQGRCVSSGTSFTCPVPDPCAGKACGNACLIEAPCRFANPPCLMPDAAGQCDAGGACLPGGAFTCSPTDACADRGCGVPCFPAPNACDGNGGCVPPAQLTCNPNPFVAACAGRACGDACDPCGGMCMNPAAWRCDSRGLCVIGPPGVCAP